jgi:hypothetical protein
LSAVNGKDRLEGIARSAPGWVRNPGSKGDGVLQGVERRSFHRMQMRHEAAVTKMESAIFSAPLRENPLRENQKTAARFRERFASDAIRELEKMYATTVTVARTK